MNPMETKDFCMLSRRDFENGASRDEILEALLERDALRDVAKRLLHHRWINTREGRLEADIHIIGDAEDLARHWAKHWLKG